MPSVIYILPDRGITAQDHTCERSLCPIAPGWARIWLDRINHRRMLRKELLPQPDSVLADAGLERSAVLLEVSKPFWRA
ncbi:DUF1127 domain-containing protein [Pannonibacter phragmitetus]|uniref:DUF1127 domain-containing protein n=1 Tax=Pannonibacter phragmitetus TaxID=121719 RepID=UPI003D2EDD6D